MSNWITPTDLKNQHPEDKQRSDFQNHFWAYLVARRLSFYIAPIFIRFGFSANQVTLFGAIVLATGLGLLVTSTSFEILLLGILLINLWYILDFVDGVVARYRGTSSQAGAFFDWIIGLIYHTALPFAVSLILYRTMSFEILSHMIKLPEITWFIIATIYTITLLTRQIIAQKSQILLGKTQNSQLSIKVTPNMIAKAVISLKSPILLVSLLIAITDVWLITYTILNLIFLLAVVGIEAIRLIES